MARAAIEIAVESRMDPKVRRDLQGVGKDAKMAGAGVQALTKAFLAIGGAAAVISATRTAFRALGREIAESVRLADQQAAAIAQMENTLKSTGGTVGLTSKSIQGMASGLERLTGIGDEATLTMQAMLLTFTNVRGEAFERATEAVLDFSTKMADGAVPSAELLRTTAIQLGKALNDPIANLGALGRSGIQFSDSQQAMIKSLAETNRLAEAQAIILDEIKKQYGGTAATLRTTLLGATNAYNSAVGTLREELGGPLRDVLIDVTNLLTDIASKKEVIEFFRGLGVVAGAAARVGLANLELRLRGISKILGFGVSGKSLAEESLRFIKIIEAFSPGPKGLAAYLEKVKEEAERAARALDLALEATERFTGAPMGGEDVVVGFVPPWKVAKDDAAEAAAEWAKELEEVRGILEDRLLRASRELWELMEQFPDPLEEANELTESWADAMADVAAHVEEISDGLISIPAEGPPGAFFGGNEAKTGFMDSFLTELAFAANEGLESVDWVGLGGKFGEAFGDEFGDKAGAIAGAAFTAVGQGITGGIAAVDFTSLGASIGTAIAPGLGTAIGAAVGALLDLATAASNAAKALGSFEFGGGAPNNRFRGLGGTSQAQQAGEQALDALESFFDQLELLLQGTVELTQNIRIELLDTGEAILTLIDSATGQEISTALFATLEQAIEAGMMMLLKSATFPERFADVIDQLLAQNLDPQEFGERLQFFVQFDEALASLAGTGVGEFIAFERQVWVMRRAIEDLGLDAETTARMLEELAAAEAFRRQQIETNVLERFAQLISQVPELQAEANRLQAQMNQARFQIEVEIIQAQLQALGLMTGAFEAMLETAREFGEQIENFRVVVPRIASPEPVTIAPIRSGGSSRADERARELSRFYEAVHQFSVEEMGGTAAMLDSLYLEFVDLIEIGLRYGESLMELEEAYESATASLIDQIKGPLRDAIQSLRVGDLNPLGLGSQLSAAQSEFDRLAALALAGDADAMAELGRAGDTLLSLGEQMFGSSAEFNRLFADVLATLEAAEAAPVDVAGFDELVAIAQEQLDMDREHLSEARQTNALLMSIEGLLERTLDMGAR